MEPHREDQSKALEPGATPKPNRFRIVKLEDRIAPSKGGGTHANTCATCATCGCMTNAGCCFGSTNNCTVGW
jgi:hypothetical protein